MLTRILIPAVLLSLAAPAFAETTSPVFGSSTQAPVTLVVNAETGLPVASADLPKPVVASTQ
jgi:hypothetical protein